MCSVAAAALVVTIVSAVATGVQQHDNQRRQVNYQNRLTDATSANAARAANADYVAAAERTNQVRQAAAQEAFEASRAVAQAQGQLTVGATYAGLGADGLVNDLRLSIANQAAQDAAIRERNASWEEAQIARSLDSISARHQSRLNSRAPQGVAGPDYVGLLGSIGSGVVEYRRAQLRRET